MTRAARPSFVFIAALLSVACTEPRPISDAGNYPYRLTPRRVRAFGTSRVLIIPARFANSEPVPMDGDAIRNAYFGGAGGGPVASAFALASGNRFTLVGEVTNWVQTSVSSLELTQPGVNSPTREGDYVLEAVRAVDHLVDFGRYDNDGPDGFPNSGDDDGFVDGGIVLMNANRNTHCGIPGATGLHPHAFTAWRDKNGVRFRTADVYNTPKDTAPRGIEIGSYVAQGVLSCGTDVGASTLTHELGHLFLGLPDMYHVVGGGTQVWEGRRWVVGCWELMASGSGWGCGKGAPPGLGSNMSLLGAWTRVRVGWSDPIVVSTAKDSVYTLRPPTDGGTVLRVPVADSEYFLVEYRERAGIDQMPPSNGVLIYHVDERVPMNPAPTAARVYRIRLMEADDGDQLIRTEGEGGDRGSATDAFGITRTTFATGAHSGARTTAGAPLPFVITEITIDAANHRATVRIKPS
jgi:M6 family metalloprotease-like protein